MNTLKGFTEHAFLSGCTQAGVSSFRQGFHTLMTRMLIGGLIIFASVELAIGATTIETVTREGNGQDIAVWLGDDDLPRVLSIDSSFSRPFDRRTIVELTTCLDPLCSFPSIEKIDVEFERLPTIFQLGFDSRGYAYFIYGFTVREANRSVVQNTSLLRCNDERCSTFNEQAISLAAYTLRADDRFMGARVNEGSDRLRLFQYADLLCTSRNSFSTIDSVTDGRLKSFTTDANGFPLFLYESGGEVLIARCNDGNCSSPLVQSLGISAGFTFDQFSVVVDAADRPVVSIANSNGLALMTCSDSLCTTSKTRTVDRANLRSDLQVDMNGNAVLAYRKSGTVRLARCQDQGCENLTREVIDQATGRSPALALDNVSNPVIAYGDNSAGIAKIARCDNLNCINNNDELPNVGTYLLRSVETGRYLDADRNGAVGTSSVPRLDDEWNLGFATAASTPFNLTNGQFATPISNTQWLPEPAGDGTFLLRRLSDSNRNYLSTSGGNVVFTFQAQSDRWEFIAVQN